MQQELVDTYPQPWADALFERIIQHYRERPLVAHFSAWLAIGLTLGFLMAPTLKLTSLLAFSISGCVCCTVLAVVTYPVSGHYRLTLVGAAAGFALSYVNTWMADAGHTSQLGIQLCLLIGALIGSTSLMWLGPIQFWKHLLFPKTRARGLQKPSASH